MRNTLVTMEFPAEKISTEFVNMINVAFSRAGYTACEELTMVARSSGNPKFLDVPWKSVVTHLSRGKQLSIAFASSPGPRPEYAISVSLKWKRNRDCDRMFWKTNVGPRGTYTPKQEAAMLGFQDLTLELHRKLRAHRTEAVNGDDSSQRLFFFSGDTIELMGDLPIRPPYEDEDPSNY